MNQLTKTLGERSLHSKLILVSQVSFSTDGHLIAVSRIIQPTVDYPTYIKVAGALLLKHNRLADDRETPEKRTINATVTREAAIPSANESILT